MSLLLLGYDLHGWDFRVLFWGVIRERSRKNISFSIQLEPNQAEREYLRKYWDAAKFDVYWGDVYRFSHELRRALKG
jgi:hypothetical protein